MFAPAVMERLTLLLNHVLGREPAAVERLRPHAGRVLRLQAEGWPGLLPPPPPMAWRVTPAGLLEWCGLEAPEGADLSVRLDATNPAALAMAALAGQPPAVQVEGDAQFAADVSWLASNLRWDVADDLERLVGPALAQGLQQWGGVVLRGLQAAMSAAGTFAARARPRAP